jgi:hypothetical protein
MKQSTLSQVFHGVMPKFKEALFAILPVVAVMIIVPFCIPDMSLEANGEKFGPVMTSLLISIVPLVLGTTLFNVGVEKSLVKIGDVVGTTLTKKKTIGWLLFIGFLMGVLATLAEPDLSVLASRISNDGPDWSLIVICAIGVGIFMLVALVRVIFNKPLKYWLTIGYLLVFTLALFADKSFFSIIFDAGGVTTGVVTVPFIIAIGVSVARSLGDSSGGDSFGYSGLCSLGTVLAVLVFSIILKNTDGIQRIQDILKDKTFFEDIEGYAGIAPFYLKNFLSALKDVSISIAPITVFFFVFNIFLKLPKKEVISVVIGLVYTFFGLIFFLMGAESGFIPAGTQYGVYFSDSSKLPLFILIGFILGAVAMLAEPSVKVLADNVAEVSHGVISEVMIYIFLCVAIGIAIVINIFRVNYQIDYIYFAVPMFLTALLLSYFVPSIYVGIAIDAAGVATGAMASCFFLPMFLSYVQKSFGSDGSAIMSYGFGVVGIMSMMPILAIEFLGVFSSVKTVSQNRKALRRALEEDDNQLIHLPLANGEDHT